jgi:hypothetical protein
MMEVVAQILVVLGVLAYLGVGVVLALFLSRDLLDGLTWWQIVLVALFWPLAIFLPIVAVALWMRDGSH